jgi:hypothetical protein
LFCFVFVSSVHSTVASPLRHAPASLTSGRLFSPPLAHVLIAAAEGVASSLRGVTYIHFPSVPLLNAHFTFFVVHFGVSSPPTPATLSCVSPLGGLSLSPLPPRGPVAITSPPSGACRYHLASSRHTPVSPRVPPVSFSYAAPRPSPQSVSFVSLYVSLYTPTHTPHPHPAPTPRTTVNNLPLLLLLRCVSCVS